LDFSLPNVKFAQAFDIATSLTSARLRSFPFILRLQRALNVGNERRIREAVRQIDDFAISVIQTRRKQLMEIASGRTTLESLEDQHMDLLSRFMGLPAQEKERSVEHEDKNQKQEAFSDRFLRDIVISFILAGRDTTSAGLFTTSILSSLGFFRLELGSVTYDLVLNICLDLFHRPIMVLLVAFMQPSSRGQNLC
jgi:cytochrome P450